MTERTVRSRMTVTPLSTWTLAAALVAGAFATRLWIEGQRSQSRLALLADEAFQHRAYIQSHVAGMRLLRQSLVLDGFRDARSGSPAPLHRSGLTYLTLLTASHRRADETRRYMAGLAARVGAAAVITILVGRDARGLESYRHDGYVVIVDESDAIRRRLGMTVDYAAVVVAADGTILASDIPPDGANGWSDEFRRTAEALLTEASRPEIQPKTLR